MSAQTFRFGLVAAPNRGAAELLALARRAESLGYSTLLVPDTPDLGAPIPAAAIAAGATQTLHVGTFVLVAPVRSAAAVAREAVTMDRLTGGRFELGLGTGRQDAERLATIYGTTFPPASERIERVKAVADAVRAEGGPRILIAGAGRRILTLAAQVADTVSFALGPDGDETTLAGAVELVREAAGPRFAELELATNLLVAGNKPAPWLRSWLGAEPAELNARGSVAVLMGTPDEMADRLSRRRDAVGTTYVTVNAESMDELAPVVELLAGK